MKIVYLIHQYWPKFQTGTENYTHFLAEEMIRNGNQVVIIAVEPDLEGSNNIERYQEGDVNVIKIHKQVKIVNRVDTHYVDEKYEDIVTHLVDEIKPDIVHIQHLMFTSIGVVRQIRKKNIPIVFTLHDFWLECLRVTMIDHKNQICLRWGPARCVRCYQAGSVNIKNKLIARLAYKGYTAFKDTILIGPVLQSFHALLNTIKGDQQEFQAGINQRFQKMLEMVSSVDLFISPSEYLRQSFIRWGIPEEKIMYSRNGMHFVDREIHAEEKQDSKVVRFVFTSQVREHKGVSVLLDAFSRLGEDVKLFIYGSCDTKSSYGKLFLKNVKKFKNVEYKGPFQNTEINKILSKADYLILPSIWPENAPLVIEEAYLNNVPCIVSNIGGMAERVNDGVDGIHFKVGDAEDLAGKIRYVTNNRQIRQYLIKKIPSVKTMEENALELIRLYSHLIQTKNV